MNPKAPRARVMARPRRADANGRLRVLAHVHGYLPFHGAGAERMLHELLVELRDRGHEVRVLLTRRMLGAGMTGDHDGIGWEVQRYGRGGPIERAYAWCDAVITHLDATATAMMYARLADRPVVHLVHNHLQLAYHRVRREQAALVVANSAWVAETIGPWWDDVVVVRPPCRPERFAHQRTIGRASAGHVTLVNCNPEKGGHVLWGLARHMPAQRFQAVHGAYGHQVPGSEPNVRVEANNGLNMPGVYQRTSVLIAPSSYESWGLAAVEAIHCGIPVVAHPTDGLRESMGDGGAAVFADRERPDEWVDELVRLDDPVYYAERSAAARARAAVLAERQAAELDEWERAVRRAAGFPELAPAGRETVGAT